MSDAKCGEKVGSKPWWMGVDQYDPCYCVLTPGHGGDCKCSHTIDKKEEQGADPEGA